MEVNKNYKNFLHYFYY